jgi:hypothetical protein
MHGDLLYAVVVTAIFVPLPLAGAIAAAVNWRKRRSSLSSDQGKQLSLSSPSAGPLLGLLVRRRRLGP